MRKYFEQVVCDQFPGVVPDDRPQFVIFMETQSVINQPHFVRPFFDDDMAALTVGIVAQQVEEHDGSQACFVFVAEVEVVIVGIVLDVLLDGTRAIGPILTQRGIGHEVPAKRLADQVSSHFAMRQGIVGKVPQRLLAFGGLVNGLQFSPFVMHIDEKGVIAAQHELAFEFEFTLSQSGLQVSLGG